MREAIGGSYIFQIVILFIALFSAFLVYSISYTKAFRVKNEILSLIEQYQGYSRADGDVTTYTDTDFESDNSVEALAYKLIVDVGYNKEVIPLDNSQCLLAAENSRTVNDNDIEGTMMPGGYCLYKLCSSENNAFLNTTYKVTTFIALKIPVLNATIKVPISGETRTIYSDAGKMECSAGKGD